ISTRFARPSWLPALRRLRTPSWLASSASTPPIRSATDLRSWRPSRPRSTWVRHHRDDELIVTGGRESLGVDVGVPPSCDRLVYAPSHLPKRGASEDAGDPV